MNRGVKGKGLAAEGLTMFVRIPSGTKVVSGAGEGDVGTMPLAKLGIEPALSLAPHSTDDTGHVERPKPDMSGDVAVWRPRASWRRRGQKYSLTLSGPLTPQVRQAFRGSTVYCENPGRKPEGSPPIMVYRDLRIPDKATRKPSRCLQCRSSSGARPNKHLTGKQPRR